MYGGNDDEQNREKILIFTFMTRLWVAHVSTSHDCVRKNSTPINCDIGSNDDAEDSFLACSEWKIENRNSKPPTNASAYNRFDCFTWSRHWKCCWQICPFQLEIICFYRLHCISKCNEIEWMQKLKFVSKLTNLAAAEMGEKEWKISFVLRFTLRTALPLLFIYVQLIFSQSVDCYLRECSSVCCGCYCWQTLPTMWKRWTNLLTASI